MITHTRRNGKSWFAEQFKNYCKQAGLSLYVRRTDPHKTDLFIDKHGVEHEVSKPCGLTFDVVIVDEAPK